ncbi:GlcG/HbpS family heme-binding protein [Phreatobacter cathodiphilus]|uniref:Glcg protein n=1 Tax=Phreatobacter cathodiphilus TaxID=1868589 RepID=A0A2S0NGU9_9HYPH|nr:heme-binding protein [Phreatobacter cathodiphilus]AVO47141.1 glcg protein [Phreatobacter cathodiphilus]
MSLSLDTCRSLAHAALATGREKGMKPLGVVIVDARGAVRLTLVEDGNAPLRADIAHGKAFGCVMVGVGGRALERMAKERPHFIGALGGLTKDRLTPVPGGVLIRDAGGAILGAVGISGDTSDNDEVCALAGIAAVGLKADTGA